MILDSSAVVAVVREEAEARSLLERMDAASSLAIGAPTLVESDVVLVGRLGRDGRALVGRFIADWAVGVVPFDEEHWREAGNAFLRFGKGRHPARLNFGDCMTYATARIAGEPLLCLGDDFANTDLTLV